MDAASLQTLIQLTLFVATFGGLLLSYRKSRQDERGQVHTLLRDDYDRLIKDREDLRTRLVECDKRAEVEAGKKDYIFELEQQMRDRDAVIQLRDAEIVRLNRRLTYSAG